MLSRIRQRRTHSLPAALPSTAVCSHGHRRPLIGSLWHPDSSTIESIEIGFNESNNAHNRALQDARPRRRHRGRATPSGEPNERTNLRDTGDYRRSEEHTSELQSLAYL